MQGQPQLPQPTPVQGVLWFLLPEIAPEMPLEWPKPVLGYRPKQNPKSHSYSLLELSNTMCRFPLTSAKPHRFCGAHAEAGRSYCEMHHNVAYTEVVVYDDWMKLKLPV